MDTAECEYSYEDVSIANLEPPVLNFPHFLKLALKISHVDYLKFHNFVSPYWTRHLDPLRSRTLLRRFSYQNTGPYLQLPNKRPSTAY